MEPAITEQVSEWGTRQVVEGKVGEVIFFVYVWSVCSCQITGHANAIAVLLPFNQLPRPNNSTTYTATFRESKICFDFEFYCQSNKSKLFLLQMWYFAYVAVNSPQR